MLISSLRSPAPLSICSNTLRLLFFFFFNDTATTEIYTLSLHDALPIFLLAAARQLKSAGKLKGNRVVATSMSNLGLERVLAREGIELARAAVGDRYVLEEMLRSNNVLGGEQSGHVIFLDDSPARDGLLTAGEISSLVSIN